MTMHLWKQPEPFGDWEEIDLEAESFCDFVLKIGDSHPAALSWQCNAGNHTFPIGYNELIKFYDDSLTLPDGTPQDEDHPLFLGWVDEISPDADANVVRIVAYDPTARASQKTVVMSGAWQAGSISPYEFPEEGFATYPRLVYNCTQDNDDDYALSRGSGGRSSHIIAGILEDAYHPLYHLGAAPGDGTAAGNDVPYLHDDLFNTESTADPIMQFEPQEKFVVTSEPIRSCIDRFMSQWEPHWRLLFHADDRRWRFYEVQSAPQTTITLNDPAASHGMVLGIDMTRSIKGRVGAVKYYGPEVIGVRTATWSLEPDSGVTNSLTDISTGPILENYGAGSTVYGKNRWQITDPDFRRIARKFPTPIYVPVGYGTWANAAGSIVQEVFQSYAQTWSPSFQVRFPSTNAGADTWKSVYGYYLDFQNGIIDFGSNYVYRYNPDPDIGGGPIAMPHVENPIQVRLIYPSFEEPISARYPSTGYAGTLHTVAGLDIEEKIYDEMLAVGYIFGTPVTTTTRRNKFAVLAQNQWHMRKDIVYAGGVQLEGLRMTYAWLNKRVNFAAKDRDGATLTTGWENVNAILTDVEYDFSERTTTLMFGSDLLELIGISPENLKQRLGIRAASLSVWFTWSHIAVKRTGWTHWGGSILGVDNYLTVNVSSGWFDDQGGVQ